MTVHDFRESLAKSHAEQDAPYWSIVYSKAFTDRLQTIQNVRNDGWAQRGGIDRLLMLTDGTVLKVDEKVRERDWPDVLLEIWSDRDKRTPGWAVKELTCDFIAYAYIPSQTCYLLPYQLLRRAMKEQGSAWLALARAGRNGFKLIEAQNRGYVTVSIAVPTELLLAAITDAMIIRWSAEEAA